MEQVPTHQAYAGRIVRVEVQSRPEGPYDIVRHPGSAAVVPVTPERDVLLVRQLRPAVGRPLVEIPAGLLDQPEEDALSCAARELFEETGFRHASIEFLGGCFPSPGYTDEYVHLFVATTRPEPEGPPEHGVELIRRPFDQMVASARAGRLRDAKTALALLLADARRLGR